MKRKLISSLTMNALIVLMTVVGFLLAFFGVNMTGHNYTVTGPIILVLFTYESNLLMIIPCSMLIVYEILILAGRRSDIPTFVYVTKLAFTVGVALTFFIVLIFLAPNNSNGFFASFANSNIFMHLLSPLFAMISFIFFENTSKIKFPLIFLGTVHTIAYMSVYAAFVFSHLIDGAIDPYYDFYGFFHFGIWTTPIIAIVFCSISSGISAGLWALNRKLCK